LRGKRAENAAADDCISILIANNGAAAYQIVDRANEGANKGRINVPGTVTVSEAPLADGTGFVDNVPPSAC
jgi:hypothetical protein